MWKKKQHTLDDFLPPDPRKSSRRRAGILVGLLCVILGIWLAYSQSGADVALVKQQLDMLASRLREDGLKEGRHVELTYGDITMAGGVADRHAEVHDVKLLMKSEHGPAGTVERPNSVLITTPLLNVHTGYNALTLSLPQPVNVASEEAPARPMLQVTTNTPIELALAQKKMDDVLYGHWHPTLPSEIRLTYLKEEQTAGEEDETPSVVPVYKTLIITSKKAATDLLLAQDDSGRGQCSVDIEELTIMPEGMPEGAINVGMVRGHWNNALDNDEKAMEGALTVDAINAAPEIIAYAPITFDFEASQHGSMPDPGTPNPQAASYQLKTFHLKTKEGSIDASADFASTAGEALPLGKASLNVKNLPFVVGELKRLRLLGEENDTLLSLIVEHVAGRPYAEVKDLDVAINRPKGGAFTIGKSTFEELFALVLSTKIQQFSNGQEKLVTPHPQPAPIVEDHGVQG